MQYRFLLVWSLAAPLLLAQAPAQTAAPKIEVMEEVVAKVNGDIITNRDLATDLAPIEAEIAKRGMSGPEADEIRAGILRSRIDESLLRQKGKDLDIKTEQEVNREVANYMRSVNIADPDEFEKVVVQQTGKPYADFRASIQDQILVQSVIREQIWRNINVPGAEVRAYYDAHKDEFNRMERVFLRQIIVNTAGKKPEEIPALDAKAIALVTRARRGEPFAALAEKESDDPSKEQGGSLEPFTRATLSEQLVPLVWDKEAGYVTDPIKVPNGWMILKVEAHHREGLAEFEEVQGEIQNNLFTTRTQPALREYLTKLRQEAFLQVKEGYVDTGAAPDKDTTWQDPAQLRPETITRAEVLANPSMKKLLGMFPVPGTEKTGASSSR